MSRIIERWAKPLLQFVHYAPQRWHSLVNKTFILNDFILSHNLDFLFITVEDPSPYSELGSANYCFYNSPRLSGRGGGLAIITKDTLRHQCLMLPSTIFSSFEAQLLQLVWPEPIVLTLIYRPPHLTKGFVEEFSEFVGDLITKYDRILL